MPFPQTILNWLQRVLAKLFNRNRNKDNHHTSTSGRLSSDDLDHHRLYTGLRNKTRRLSRTISRKVRRISPGQTFLAAMEEKKVLVYHHRAEGKSVLPGGKGLEVISHGQLEDILRDNAKTLKLTRKALPPGTSSVDIYQKDIASPSSSQENLPNSEQNVASVSIPLKVQLGNYVFESYPELVILSWRVGSIEV
ncbi:hypothetical protein PRZ48_004530 [Zasmidium cellare]|uniref:Uncharacterized protein n=1 Tax=Zasmidium cellare TaxID=395010 RepID=A0ABR0EQ39_ZASCE|nr:hypothetical protein PRZ48_004530 [Zasmidium cellare]